MEKHERKYDMEKPLYLALKVKYQKTYSLQKT